MLKKFTLIFTIISTAQASFWLPDIGLYQPPYARKNNAKFTSLISYFKSTKAYNTQGNAVSLLKQYGAEHFFKRYVDNTLSKDNTESWGDIHLSGQLHNLMYLGKYSYHPTDHFFLQLNLIANDFCIKQIKANYVNSIDTKEHMQALELLEKKLNYVQKYGLLSSRIEAGYANCFQNFTYIDFIDISISTQISFPQWNNSNKNELLHIPGGSSSLLTNSIIGAISCGILDWLNFSTSTKVNFAYSAPHSLFYNYNDYENTLLADKQITAKIYSCPSWDLSIQMEGEHILPGISFVVGYSIHKQYKTYFKDLPTYINEQKLNNIKKYTGSTSGILYTEISLDFAQEKCPYIPKFSIAFSFPVHGKHAYKGTNIIGSCTIQCNKEF